MICFHFSIFPLFHPFAFPHPAEFERVKARPWALFLYLRIISADTMTNAIPCCLSINSSLYPLIAKQHMCQT